eukprot:tig00021517_g22007.t1
MAAVLWDAGPAERERARRYARAALEAARASGPAFLPHAVDGLRGPSSSSSTPPAAPLLLFLLLLLRLRLPPPARPPRARRGAPRGARGRRRAFVADCGELAARVAAWAGAQRCLRHAALRMRGELAMLRGEPDEAARLLSEAAGEARARGFPLDEAFCLLRAAQARAAGPRPAPKEELEAELEAPAALFAACGCALGASLVERLRRGHTLL